MKIILLLLSLALPGEMPTTKYYPMPSIEACTEQVTKFHQALDDYEWDLKTLRASASCAVQFTPNVCRPGDIFGEALGNCIRPPIDH